MSKVAVVYWTGTGNTEAMAKAVAEGVTQAGGEASLIFVNEFTAADAAGYDAIAWGCPAMGDEVLDDTEFEPVFNECKPACLGKKIALFGSYGWGDGQWMRDWEQNSRDAGLNLVCDSLIVHETPDEDGLDQCRALGKALAI